MVWCDFPTNMRMDHVAFSSIYPSFIYPSTCDSVIHPSVHLSSIIYHHPSNLLPYSHPSTHPFITISSTSSLSLLILISRYSCFYFYPHLFPGSQNPPIKMFDLSVAFWRDREINKRNKRRFLG